MTRDITIENTKEIKIRGAPLNFWTPNRIDRSRYWHFSTNLEAPKQSASRPFDTKHVGAVNRNPGQTEKWWSAPGASGPGTVLVPAFITCQPGKRLEFFSIPTNQIPYQASLYDRSPMVSRDFTRELILWSVPQPATGEIGFCCFVVPPIEDLSFRKVAHPRM